MRLPEPLAFEWDKGNIEKNWRKHSIHYKEAEEIFFNKPIKVFPDTKHSTKEIRYLALGKTNHGIHLTIIFTIRKRRIRIISARKQSKRERNAYEN